MELSETCWESVGSLSGVKLSKRQYSICGMIKENPYTSAQAMAELLAVNSRTIERDLSSLQKLGIVRHEGSKSAGVWVILEHDKN